MVSYGEQTGLQITKKGPIIRWKDGAFAFMNC